MSAVRFPLADGPVGFLAQNFGGLQDNAPGVIVNPDAHPLAVLAWCWGEIESLSAAALVFDAAGSDVDSGAFGSVFVHRLVPLSAVMGQAVAALVGGKDRMADVGNAASGVHTCAQGGAA